MKKFFLLFACACTLFASKQTLIKAPAASAHYVNLIPGLCDKECLYDLLYDGSYLSFLARFTPNDDEQLFNYYSKLLNGYDYLNIPAKARLSEVKIAVVLPELSLKSYSSNIVSPVLAYLIAKKTDAYMQVFYTGTERFSPELAQQLAGFNLIITGFNGDGLLQMANTLSNKVIFSPLASLDNFPDAPRNLYFGSINYDEQIAKLMSIASHKVGVFGDNSQLSNKLNDSVIRRANVVFMRKLEPKDYNVAAALNGAYALNASSVFFNLALIKTTLIATQLHALNIKATNYLSTQINYHPVFLNLAQDTEKNKFYFANMIGKVDANIEYLNELLGQKISYNWIAYSTSAGLDNLFAKLYQSDEPRLFENEFINHNLMFNTKIMSAKYSKFSEVQ